MPPLGEIHTAGRAERVVVARPDIPSCSETRTLKLFPGGPLHITPLASPLHTLKSIEKIPLCRDETSIAIDAGHIRSLVLAGLRLITECRVGVGPLQFHLRKIQPRWK